MLGESRRRLIVGLIAALLCAAVACVINSQVITRRVTLF